MEQKLIVQSTSREILNFLWKLWRFMTVFTIACHSSSLSRWIQSILWRSLLMLKFRVFWNVLPCSQIDVDRHLRGACCLYHQRPDDGGSTHLWNVSRHRYENTAVHSKRLWTSYSLPWEPEILHFNVVPSVHRSYEWSFLFRLSIQNFVHISHIPNTCCIPCRFHALRIDFLITFGGENKLQSSSCSFLQPPVAQSLRFKHSSNDPVFIP
jgi:hypothetical protein